jgi:5'-3' exonuclease
MKTLIIDGNNLIHRTYWTAKTQSQRTNTDTPEQINNFHIYFTLNAVFSYVTKFNPDKTIFVWDEKPDYQINERKAEYENYKGNRSSDITPHQNNQTIKLILHYLGIPSIFPRELEADDIISYICNKFTGQKVIISVDKDFLQLVQNDTTLYDPIRKKEYTIENFEEETGWSNIGDWMTAKCCMGDKSDNVTGIEKFGKAKIKKWIDGEIYLNEDQMAIYDRNFSLFNLGKVMTMDEECKYYQKQLDTSIESNWAAFIDECTLRNFNSILKKKESWYSLFFLRNKLQSLFT